MPDEKTIDLNLEPVSDDDFDLSKKFGHIEKNQIGSVGNKKEGIPSVTEKEKAQEISPAEKESAYSRILSKVSQKSVSPRSDDIKSDAEAVSKKMDADSQIQHLVDLATTKGAIHAIKVAKHMEDNYVLDMLHDKMISEELHKVLVEKNLISEE
ncbi:MAG: hypothetical protein WC682_00575 [Parcubacteria group bacterium]|jgi:hypothetical protein